MPAILSENTGRGPTLLRAAATLTLALGAVDCYLLFQSLVESHHYRGGGPLYLFLSYKLLKKSRWAYVGMLRLLPFIVFGAIALGVLKVIEERQMTAAGIARLPEFSNTFISGLSSNAFAIELALLAGILATLAHQRTRSLFNGIEEAGPRWSLHLPPRKWLLPPVVATILTMMLSGPHLFRNPFNAGKGAVMSRLPAGQTTGAALEARTLGIRNWAHLSVWKVAAGGHSRTLRARVNHQGIATVDEPH